MHEKALMELIAVEQIKKLKARYFRFLDTKDYIHLAELFTSDARIDVTKSTIDSRTVGEAVAGFDDVGIIVGGAAFVEFLTPMWKDVISAHHGHMPEIDLTSDNTASGIWSMEDVVLFLANGRSMHGYGFYHETYRLLNGTWLIESLKITRLRVDFTP